MNKAFLFTLIAAVLLLLFAVLCLGIGRLMTGKTRLKKGCGLSPRKAKKNHCDLCGNGRGCDDDESDAGKNPRKDPK